MSLAAHPVMHDPDKTPSGNPRTAEEDAEEGHVVDDVVMGVDDEVAGVVAGVAGEVRRATEDADDHEIPRLINGIDPTLRADIPTLSDTVRRPRIELQSRQPPHLHIFGTANQVTRNNIRCHRPAPGRM